MALTGTMALDIRHALRLFRRNPLFTAVAILALAIGIGGSIAIFTVVNAVLLRPLPYRDAGRLALVWSEHRRDNRPRNPISPANFVDYRAGVRSISGMEAMHSFLVAHRFATEAGTDLVQGLSVTPGMFRLLGRDAAHGRTFQDGESAGAVILSHGFWQRRFGGDRGIIGREVVVTGQPAVVIGVMPADFVFPFRPMLGPSGFTRGITADIWLPLDFRGDRMVDAGGRFVRNVHFLAGVARLQEGALVEQAQAELTAVARQLETGYPESNTGWGATLVPILEQTVGDVRNALVMLLAGVGLLLVIACVNVANLVLARSMARQREIAVRSALGASRSRLVRQVLTETMILSSAGALLGLVAVRWGIALLVAWAPPEIPRLQDVRPDVVVLATAFLTAIVAGALVGLVPALAATASDLNRSLQDGSRGAAGGRHRRARAALVVAEVALASVLAVGALLLARSFGRLLDVDPGFKPARLLTLQMNLPDRLTTAGQRREFYREFFTRIESLPGVLNAGGTTRLPLGSTNVSTQVAVEGRSVDPARLPEVEFRRALRNYFETMGIPVLRGRAFDDRDAPDAPGVVVINQTMARRLFPGEDPVGKRVRTGPNPSAPWSTIIGIVGDIRHESLDIEPGPELYVSSRQNPPVAPFIVIRTAGDPAAIAAAVRAEARAIDRQLVLFDIRTMEEVRSASVARRRFLSLLAALFSVVALVLAAAGVHGVMALVVAERTPEIGVRLALGARPVQVWALVLGEGLALVLAGAAAGLVLARLAVPLMASQLFGVGAGDPVTLVLVPALLAAIALASCYGPARRAMHIDPVVALRSE